MRVIIKGTPEEAETHANARGIPLVLRGETKHGETVGVVSANYIKEVIAWYHEAGVPPYPVGTLLHFSMDRRS